MDLVVVWRTMEKQEQSRSYIELAHAYLLF